MIDFLKTMSVDYEHRSHVSYFQFILRYLDSELLWKAYKVATRLDSLKKCFPPFISNSLSSRNEMKGGVFFWHLPGVATK